MFRQTDCSYATHGQYLQSLNALCSCEPITCNNVALIQAFPCTLHCYHLVTLTPADEHLLQLEVPHIITLTACTYQIVWRLTQWHRGRREGVEGGAIPAFRQY